VHIKADLTRLFHDCGFSQSRDQPFVGAVELGVLAKQRGVVERANVGLADLTAAILHHHLPKEQAIRVSTEWDNLDLTSRQIEYAALDVFAASSIYDALCTLPTGGSVVETTLGGTQVKLMSRDNHTPVAYGVIAPDQPTRFDGVNVTKTRVVINVTGIKIGAYLVCADLLKSKKKIPLSSLAVGLPFQLLCYRRDLQICPPEEYHRMQTSIPSTPLPTAITVPHNEEHQSHNTLTHTSDPAADEESWMENIDYDPEGEQELGDSVLDTEGGEKAKALDKLSRLPPPGSPIRSRVLGDILHLMAMFKISMHHGLQRPFARQLRDAILIPDPHDKAMLSRFLEEKMDTFEQAVLRRSDWVWRRMKRYVPPPEVLFPCVKLIFQVFGPLKDAVTGQPLFNDASWEKAQNILENIRLGHYSDPPGIALYMSIGKDANGLNLYKCLRGTNQVEGGVHQHIARWFGPYNASPRFAVNLLRDYCLIHNLKVCV